MIRVLVADDHPLLRSGIKQLLALEPGFATPGEAGDSDELFDLLDTESWDVVLLDISLPRSSGLETLREIRRRQPALSVLILSVHSETQFAFHALRLAPGDT